MPGPPTDVAEPVEPRLTTGTAGGAPAPSDGWAYRPHLDGLRAVAVYLVVAFHAGADRLSGGFIGVDVFFVLSGYLVTNLLVRDIGVAKSIRFGRFYARRMRRLLPAAGVNLLVTAVVFRAIGAPTEFPSAVGSMRAASLYVSNWWFIRESADYFGSNIAASPVAHYWSLSVEEQFYLAWPILLGALAVLARRFGRRHRLGLAAIVAVLGSASLMAALTIATTDPNRAYFGTDTRAYQLLAGALLALVPSLAAMARRIPGSERLLPVAAAAFLGVLVIAATSAVAVGPVTRGVIATVATAGIIVALEAGSGGVTKAALSIPALTYLGRISYGTYLWHWIVILVAVREWHMAPLTTLAATIPIATGIAALSYHVVERPIRTAASLDRRRTTVIAVGLATSLFIGLVAVPRLLDTPGVRTEAAAPTSAGTPVTVDWDAASREVPDDKPCSLGPTNVCPLVSGSGPRVLLVGDSHASMLAPAFVGVAERHDLDLAAAYLPYCPWPRGIRYPVFGADCPRDQQRLYEQRIAAYDPDIVVLVHRTVDDANDPLPVVDSERGRLEPGTAAHDAAVATRARASVRELRRQGRKVVIVEPIPVSRSEESPLPCLSKAEVLEECRFVTLTTPLPEERVFRALDAADDGVWSLDLDPAVCPQRPICDPVVDGRIVLYDNSHLTSGFAASLTGRVDRFLLGNGVITA